MDNIFPYEYFYGNEADQFSFYRIPRLLITGKQFKDLSIDAKLLYGLMLDRMGISKKNGWFDENGRVYIYYPMNEIEENLNCGHNKAIRLVAELDQESGIGLIERRRQGQGKPSAIYVKRFICNMSDTHESFRNQQGHAIANTEVSKQDFLTFQNQTSRGLLLKPQEVSNYNPNYNNLNYINSAKSIESNLPNRTDGISRENCMKMLQDRVEYSVLSERYQGAELDEIMELIVEVLCSTNATIRVNGSQIPIRFVKDRFQTLDRFHIQYVIDCLRENTTAVRNIRAYLLTTLYNAPTTIEHYYQAKVQHDLYGQ